MCNDKHHKPVSGEALEHGNKHTKAHQAWTRRNFLYSLGMAGGSAMTLGGLPVSSLGLSPLSFLKPTASGGDSNGRILVMIRLKGGNDGLNTIVPTFDYSTYFNNRPQIAIPQSNLMSLNSEFAIPNTMSSLLSLWEADSMKVVNSVGYADQNLSHFESIDIWSSGSENMEQARSGWLGRYYTDLHPDYQDNPSLIPPAIKIGGPESILFYDENAIDLSINVTSAEELSAIADSGVLYDTSMLVDDCYYGEQVDFLRNVANTTFRYADVISEAYNSGNNVVDYSNPLGRQLKVVSKLIKGQLGTQLYMVTLDGFDTHVSQANTHSQLMSNLAEAVTAFYKDLEAENLDKEVLTMTFSEFGRRVQQNASNGTDHGTAAPVMLFGPGLLGSGILGNNPDLHDLDNAGNLKHGTDFRSIYASVLEFWLCAEPSNVDMILGDTYDRIDLGLSCSPVSAVHNPINQGITHRAYQHGGQLWIECTLARPDNLTVELYSILGQPLATLFRGYADQGVQTYSIPVGQYGTMPVIYRINNGKQQLSSQFILK